MIRARRSVDVLTAAVINARRVLSTIIIYYYYYYKRSSWPSDRAVNNVEKGRRRRRRRRRSRTYRPTTVISSAPSQKGPCGGCGKGLRWKIVGMPFIRGGRQAESCHRGRPRRRFVRPNDVTTMTTIIITIISTTAAVAAAAWSSRAHNLCVQFICL